MKCLGRFCTIMMFTLVGLSFSLVSCDKDKSDEETLSQQMLGKWVLDNVTTNEKVVYTFESETKGYISASRLDYSETHVRWADHVPCDVKMDGNNITLMGHLSKTTSFMAEIMVKSSSKTEMLTDLKYTVYYNGDSLYGNSGTASWTKVENDYSQDILGTWEGRVTSSGGSEYDDGKPHRWEYLNDGSYVYWSQEDNGQWTAGTSVFSQYFVDGTLLCTRWKNVGEDEVEHREWWEISSISESEMNWVGFRQRENGGIDTVTFSMTKVRK